MFLRERISDGSRYFRDRSQLKGRAKNVILPNDETELREGIRYSNKGNTKVTISGSRMGSAGGSVPTGGDVMSMENLSGVLGVGRDEKGIFLRVLPNTTVRQFNNYLSRMDFEYLDSRDEFPIEGGSFPVDVPPEHSVGGTVSTNRSGIRPYVRRIKVVFSDSTFMTLGRGEYIAEGRRMSFPAGRNFFCFDIPSYDSKEDVGPRISENMDLMDLFIGSEGIFCIITEADIYLSDRPESVETVECGKLLNGRIGEIHGQRSVEELKKVKEILDAAYILNVGNLL